MWPRCCVFIGHTLVPCDCVVMVGSGFLGSKMRGVKRSSRGYLSLFRVWLACVLALVWLLPASGGAEIRFRDDFNRPNSDNVGNGWNTTPNHNECLQPGEAEKSGGDSTRTVKEKNLLFEEISREIEKKTDHLQAEKNPESRFKGSQAKLLDGMLFFQYAHNQDAQMVQQEFPKKVTRISYDVTPLYAMGGLDDRGWIGVRIYYLDADDLILGEVRNFFYHAVFEEKENTDTIHTRVQKGLFDGTVRHETVDAQQILNQQLRGVEQNRIVKTRISFEIASGLCESSLEGYVDNVSVIMDDVLEPFRVTKEMLMEMTDMSVELFTKNRHGFPGNWKKAIFDKYGKEKIKGWVGEIPSEEQGDLGRLTDFLAQRYQLTGKEAWLAGYAVTMLLQVL